MRLIQGACFLLSKGDGHSYKTNNNIKTNGHLILFLLLLFILLISFFSLNYIAKIILDYHLDSLISILFFLIRNLLPLLIALIWFIIRIFCFFFYQMNVS